MGSRSPLTTLFSNACNPTKVSKKEQKKTRKEKKKEKTEKKRKKINIYQLIVHPPKVVVVHIAPIATHQS